MATTLERSDLHSDPIDLAIEGMTCASCVRRIERALEAVPGVRSVTVDLANEKAHVEGAGVAPSTLVATVTKSGYRATVLEDDPSGAANAALDQQRQAQSRREGWAAAIAIALSLPLVLPMLAMPFGVDIALPPWLQFLLAAPVQFVLGARFYRAGLAAARARSPNMDLLVALGTSAAFGLSLWNWLVVGHGGHGLYFEAAALVIALVLLGKWMEGRAKRMTGAALRALAAIRPTTARVIVDGTEVELPIGAVSVGDYISVRPGERVAVDGEIVEGTSHLDESMVTGESLPVIRSAGQKVIGGTINLDGPLLIAATAVGGDTMLSRIIRLVETAQAKKAHVQLLVDRISAWFVPVILLIALGTAIAWWYATGDLELAILNAVTVMVIACPCALGLATPMAVVAATGAGARAGILIRDPAVLEAARSIDLVAFDKTGTLTVGKPELVEILPANGQDDAALFAMAAGLQSGSEHPLAAAIRQAATVRDITPPRTTDLRTLAGKGVEGKVDGLRLAILSERAMLEVTSPDLRLLAAARDEAGAGRTVSWLVDLDHGTALAALSFGDQARPEAKAAVAALRARGVATAMLTGDNRGAAEAIASDLGIDEVHAELLPEDKVGIVHAAHAAGRRVAMVGDGINDAPALAAADLGIAIGSGTDVAMASAGFTLVRPDPRLVPAALDLAERTRSTIIQGLVFAFGYNVLLIPIAAAGLLTPVFAGAAMALSSVSVVANAWRLGRWRANC
jgi:Cu+-exporting ATPase